MHYKTREHAYRAGMIANLNIAIFSIREYCEQLIEYVNEEISALNERLKAYEKMRIDEEDIEKYTMEISKIEKVMTNAKERDEMLIEKLKILQKPISYNILTKWKNHCIMQEKPSQECLNCIHRLEGFKKELEEKDRVMEEFKEFADDFSERNKKDLEETIYALENIVRKMLFEP